MIGGAAGKAREGRNLEALSHSLGPNTLWLEREGQKYRSEGDRLATGGDGTRHGARRWSEEGAALVRLIKLMRSGGSGGYLGGGKGKEERGRDTENEKKKQEGGRK